MQSTNLLKYHCIKTCGPCVQQAFCCFHVLRANTLPKSDDTNATLLLTVTTGQYNIKGENKKQLTVFAAKEKIMT